MNSSETLWVTVSQVTHEADDIRSFELRPLDGGLLPPFEAGAHVDVHIGTQYIRQYSLCNNPTERDRYEIGVLNDRTGRGGSTALFELFEVGHKVQISVPRNHFRVDPEAEHVLLIGAGIGITPLLSMAEQLHSAARSFELVYRSRCRERAGFVERINTAPWSGQAQIYLSSELVQPFELDTVLASAASGVQVYTCGPEGFIAAVEAAAGRALLSPSAVRKELFTNATLNTATGEREFKVTLAQSGGTYTIPVGRSVVDVLQEEGVDVLVSCESGVCGSCVVGVIDGVPEHRDVFLTDEERASNAEFTPCCSRAVGDHLTIDL